MKAIVYKKYGTADVLNLTTLLDIFEKCEEKREIRVYQDAKNVCFPRTYANLKHCTLGLA